MRRSFATGPKSWILAADTLDLATRDLLVKNPDALEAAALRSPEAIIADMLARGAETAKILESIRGML